MKPVQQFTQHASTSEDLQGEALQLYYIPLAQAVLWDRNPKSHDIGAIAESIERYGFKDPPAWDEALQGLIEGNGRTFALTGMQKQGRPAPRGILVNKETGEWCIPILFGVNATSRSIAERYAIDHNNLTLMGGDLTMFDIAKIWDRDAYLAVLQDLAVDGEMPVSVDFDDLSLLEKEGLEFESLPDLTGDADLENSVSKASFRVIVDDGDYIDEATDIIKGILLEHPEWQAHIV